MTTHDPVAQATRGRHASGAGNLPTALSSFVGRHHEIGAVAALLGSSRLVTLTGPGGVGKTRLAVEVAAAVAGDYPDGGWLVELASVSEPEMVTQAIASALGVRQEPGRPLAETLANRLASGELLLVLDNCEHLVAACAALVARLLGTCPRLSVVATSQERLKVPGERSYPVAPLSLPPAGGAAFDAVARSESVGLFVERAVEVRPDFSLDATNAAAVGEICRSLDGIPLAIELAAARLDVLSPAEIAARLAGRLDLLAGGRRTGPARHQTLRSALEWSYELLSNTQRTVLARLSVFVGGFGLDAAEEVCAGEPDAQPVLEVLAALVAKSLVVADKTAERTRYRLLDTIRHFALEQLEASGEAAEVRAAHTWWYVRLAERGEPELTGADQPQWIDRLAGDYDNLRSAFEWSMREGESAWALRLAGSLTLFWRVRGLFGEGWEWLSAALATGEGAPPALRAKAWFGVGLMSQVLGADRHAVAASEEGLALFRDAGDVGGMARTLLVLGNAWQFLNDADRAVLLLGESVSLAREAADTWCQAHALAMSAFAAVYRQDSVAARRLFEECLAIARPAGDAQSLAMGLNGLATVALDQGDYRLAEQLLEEALAVTRSLGETYGTAKALSGLGDVAAGGGDLDQARHRLDEALALGRRTGSLSAVIPPLCSLGRVAQAADDAALAHRLFHEAAQIAAQTGQACPQALLGLGQLAQASGEPKRARDLFDQALATARATRNRRDTARALHDLATLARVQGDDARATALHHEALELRHEIGDKVGLVESLESLAGLAVAAGRLEKAARLFGATQALRERHGYARSPAAVALYDADVASLGEGLGADEVEKAWSQGAQLSMAEALDHAIKGKGPRARPPVGWASLTKTEWQIVALVDEDLTNKQIAARLLISPRTVQSHLAHIFAKLGVHSRRELSRLASTNAGADPP